MKETRSLWTRSCQWKLSVTQIPLSHENECHSISTATGKRVSLDFGWHPESCVHTTSTNNCILHSTYTQPIEILVLICEKKIIKTCHPAGDTQTELKVWIAIAIGTTLHSRNACTKLHACMSITRQKSRDKLHIIHLCNMRTLNNVLEFHCFQTSKWLH